MEERYDYTVGIYCRLSKDDDTEGESSSILTQRAMLTDYCIECGYSIFVMPSWLTSSVWYGRQINSVMHGWQVGVWSEELNELLEQQGIVGHHPFGPCVTVIDPKAHDAQQL